VTESPGSYPEYQDILVERIGRVLRIAHDRPEQRNAESTRLLDELDDALRIARTDPEVGAVILGGEGAHFSAGHDLKEALAERAHYSVEERWAYEEQRYFNYALNIWDFPKPTIAEVRGACMGGAFMVANMCDLVVASDDAFFADPVVLSIAAASVEVLIHPYVMGLRRAKEFLFTGERMDAHEAYRIGMINRVVAPANLRSAVLEFAERMAAAPPFAIAMTKRSLNRTADLSGFRAALSAHFETHQLTHVTQETREIRARGADHLIGRGSAAGKPTPAATKQS
jgi:enoyl-CoA hydratase